MNDRITVAIWRAQAANGIGRQNTTKRAQREGMLIAAAHIASELFQNREERESFMKACGFTYY